MEDAHCCIVGFDDDPEAAFFAIFDGHLGAEVANFCASKVTQIFLQTPEYKQGYYAEALKQSFIELDSVMLTSWPLCFEDAPLTGPCEREAPGSTALALFIKNGVMYVANAGDCRAVLCESGRAVNLTHDHRPEDEKERARIEKAGGYVEDGRVNGVLAMSRALGDFFHKGADCAPEEQGLTACPDIVSRNLSPEDEFVVMGCDGVWETMTSDEVVAFVRPRLEEHRRTTGASKISSVAAALEDEVLAPDIFTSDGIGLDNMTCIIIVLGQEPTESTADEIIAPVTADESIPHRVRSVATLGKFWQQPALPAVQESRYFKPDLCKMCALENGAIASALKFEKANGKACQWCRLNTMYLCRSWTMTSPRIHRRRKVERDAIAEGQPCIGSVA